MLSPYVLFISSCCRCSCKVEQPETPHTHQMWGLNASRVMNKHSHWARTNRGAHSHCGHEWSYCTHTHTQLHSCLRITLWKLCRSAARTSLMMRWSRLWSFLLTVPLEGNTQDRLHTPDFILTSLSFFFKNASLPGKQRRLNHIPNGRLMISKTFFFFFKSGINKRACCCCVSHSEQDLD